MMIKQTIKLAWKSILANKLRTALTVLGIVIGITAVMVVFSAGEGIRGLILGQIESFGSDFIQTEIKVPSNKKGAEAERESAFAMAYGSQVTTLTLDDFEDILKLKNVNSGYAAIISQERVSYLNESKKSVLYGVTADYINIDKSEIDYGRFFDDSEDKSLSQVVVLGSGIKEDLFGDSDPIGKFITLHKKKFKVIGVLQERGKVMSLDFDSYIYIPLRTLQKKMMGIDYVQMFLHKLNDTSLTRQTANEAEQILRENHDIYDASKDDFRVTTMEEMMEMLNTITSVITLMLIAIVVISLIVGGVGILNVMYVIVAERNAEIGLRKAVGAKFSDIMWQFLLESVVISSLGAVIGMLIGIFISWLLAVILNQIGLDWNFIIPFKAFIVSILFALVFGVFFGVYPAKKAAKLDPIEALRK
ncbi:MAG: ABC transporter permease [Candidatus Pacebacteria bacterium]|nr:ABC transporter permease [Candidatus Paceibacterota bacterium]